MPRVKRPRRTVIGILWNDTQAALDNAAVQPIPMVTFGELVEENGEFVRIRSEIHADGTGRDYTSVPRGVIRRIIIVGSFPQPIEFDNYRKQVEGD